MLYYVNWKLTRAQVELIAADVSVVDYNYGKKKRGVKKGEFDDRKANVSDVRKAREEWLKRYGGGSALGNRPTDEMPAGKAAGTAAGRGIAIGDVFAGSLNVDKGYR